VSKREVTGRSQLERRRHTRGLTGVQAKSRRASARVLRERDAEQYV